MAEVPQGRAVVRRSTKLLIGALLAGLLFFVLWNPLSPAKVHRFSGAIMGTTYHVTLVNAPRNLSLDAVEQETMERLQAVDALMSTYKPDSEVSGFNRTEPGRWYTVTEDTAQVVDIALKVSELSNGAFDVTVGPLVELWGFGAGGTAQRVPSADAINAARARVGHSAIQLRPVPPGLRKMQPVEIDLSAIAKGYAVDQVADHLEARGITNYLVEVGGELRSAGSNPDGHVWEIGIEAPSLLHSGAVQVIGLGAAAVATSGDYRNYFEQNGQRYSHTIDPRTGTPVQHRLASVTVVHPSAAWADALATAINVLGPEEGFELAQSMKLAVYLLIQTDAGFEQRSTSGFARYLIN